MGAETVSFEGFGSSRLVAGEADKGQSRPEGGQAAVSTERT